MNNNYPFTLTPLNYPYNALEPFLNSELLYNHHTCNVSQYVENLNQSIQEYKQYKDWSLKALVVYTEQFPKELRNVINYNASGIYNHEIYFNSMSQKRNTTVSGEFKNAIDKQFGSFSKFKDTIKSYAMSIKGSGYTWLTFNKDMVIQIINTEKQSTPPLIILEPILNLDVWEHSFNSQYICHKGLYIDSWFMVVDWEKASKIYNTKYKLMT